MAFEVSDAEKEFRNDIFKDEKDIFNKNILCTLCSKNLEPSIRKENTVVVHPILEVLICSSCHNDYSNANVVCQKYAVNCQWCRKNNNCYGCTTCHCRFCESCTIRNTDSETLKALKSPDWKCFICDSKPIWTLRAICYYSRRFIMNRNTSYNSENEALSQIQKSITISSLDKSVENLCLLANTLRLRTEELKRRKINNTFIQNQNNVLYCVEKVRVLCKKTIANLVHIKEKTDCMYKEWTHDYDIYFDESTFNVNDYRVYIKSKSESSDQEIQTASIERNDQLIQTELNLNEIWTQTETEVNECSAQTEIETNEQDTQTSVEIVEQSTQVSADMNHRETQTEEKNQFTQTDETQTENSHTQTNETQTENNQTQTNETQTENNHSQTNETQTENNQTQTNETQTESNQTQTNETQTENNYESTQTNDDLSCDFCTKSIQSHLCKKAPKSRDSSQRKLIDKDLQSNTKEINYVKKIEEFVNDEENVNDEKIDLSNLTEHVPMSIEAKNEDVAKIEENNESVMPAGKTESDTENGVALAMDIESVNMDNAEETDLVSEIKIEDGEILEDSGDVTDPLMGNESETANVNIENGTDELEITSVEKILTNDLSDENADNDIVFENNESVLPVETEPIKNDDDENVDDGNINDENIDDGNINEESIDDEAILENAHETPAEQIDFLTNLNLQPRDQTNNGTDDNRRSNPEDDRRSVRSVGKDDLSSDSNFSEEEEKALEELMSNFSSSLESDFSNDEDEDSPSIPVQDYVDEERFIGRITNKKMIEEEPLLLLSTEAHSLIQKDIKLQSCEIILDRIDISKYMSQGVIMEKEIERLINLTSLDQKKRRHSSSGSSTDNEYLSERRLRPRHKKPKYSDSDSSDDERSSDKSSSADNLKNLLREEDSSDADLFLDGSSSAISSDNESDKDGKKNDEKNKTKKKKDEEKSEDQNEENKSEPNKEDEDDNRSSDSASSKSKSDWKNDPLLRNTLTDTREVAKKKETEFIKNHNLLDSDVEILSDDSDDSVKFCESIGMTSPSKKRKKRKKRNRTNDNEIVISSDTSSDSDITEVGASKAGGIPSKGRKNIRQLLDDEALDEATKKATKQEEERLQRLSERNRSYQEILSQQTIDETLTETLVLEYDLHTKEPLIKVNPKLFSKLKEHQIEGVKFMWDACFESAHLSCTTRGSGCVLAHCMGLGKTLQVITLIHTLFSYEVTGVKRILILTPFSTVLNWENEFRLWLSDIEPKFSVYTFTRFKLAHQRVLKLQRWYKRGGVAIFNYTMFRVMVQNAKNPQDVYRNTYFKTLLDPGPNLVVCDEGHLLKNEKTSLSKSVSKIKTGRLIMLTGTPMQNNLKEYYCMVNLVKPSLLGSYSEYTNRFENPIKNGQHKNSNEDDIRLMKRRSHVLHKMLTGVVQRREDTVLKPYLPHLYHYTVFVCLSALQHSLYAHYLNKVQTSKGTRVLSDYHTLKRSCFHPRSLRTDMEKKMLKSDLSAMYEQLTEDRPQKPLDQQWWEDVCTNDVMDSFEVGSKLQVLFSIINECEAVKDKLVVFSTSLHILNTVEYYLKIGPGGTNLKHTWTPIVDYLRLDGKLSVETRNEYCNMFNDSRNKSRLFLASMKACGLGINLTGANRIVILDTSWNPSDDMQGVFRIFRFGQNKSCYVYRLVAYGTMEQKIYERSVTKQAMSCRVVDEQQIDRHYDVGDTKELYEYYRPEKNERPIPKVPADRVLAGLLQSLKDIIWKYHEHDKLLQNQEDEELNEEERKAAWDEFQREENAKKFAKHAREQLVNLLRKKSKEQRNLLAQSAEGTAINDSELNSIIENYNLSYPQSDMVIENIRSLAMDAPSTSSADKQFVIENVRSLAEFIRRKSQDEPVACESITIDNIRSLEDEPIQVNSNALNMLHSFLDDLENDGFPAKKQKTAASSTNQNSDVLLENQIPESSRTLQANVSSNNHSKTGRNTPEKTGKDSSECTYVLTREALINQAIEKQRNKGKLNRLFSVRDNSNRDDSRIDNNATLNDERQNINRMETNDDDVPFVDPNHIQQRNKEKLNRLFSTRDNSNRDDSGIDNNATLNDGRQNINRMETANDDFTFVNPSEVSNDVIMLD